tara:strand:- start:1439 stop:2095 length:657 start_codon:yes stop_codon:yes gene_type:complete
MANTKLHGNNYKLKDGKRAASVTTIIGNMLGWNKNTLIAWAKRMTMAGEDSDAVMRDAGHIGTLLHILIQGHIQGFDVSTEDFTPNQEKQALIAFGGYMDWINKTDFKPLVSELALVNEDLRVGGTIDCIARINEKLVVVDWKSSKYGPYPEMIVQLGAYVFMYEAAQPKAKVDHGLIMRFGKEDGKFHQHHIGREKIDAGAQIFKHCVALNKLKTLL